LSPELEELDDYGGGDEGTVDHVAELLDEIGGKLLNSKVEEQVRREILDEVIPFIESGNAGLDDQLYDLAYATCYSDKDLRHLAQMLEAMNMDWPTDHARRIYRKLGDRAKYLELRHKKLRYGGDYHDLATFYWEEGSRNEALSVAEEGKKKGEGRMDELRKFLSDRAREGGNREQYLALQFEQTTDHLTLEKYNAFKKTCTAEEWKIHELKILERLDTTWSSESLKIRMERKEYDQALAILLKNKYPRYAWDSADELKTAKQLEDRFPEQILTYYLSGLGNLNSNATRNEYTERAKVMLKVRHMMVDIIKDETRWKVFAGKVKRDNLRRPAFQEEFGRVIAGWRELP